MNRPTSNSALADRSRRPLHVPRRWVVLMLAAALGPTLAHGQPADGATVHSRDIGAVVELFTSQGCSACPGADDALTALTAEEGETLTLAYHVDYWDYIGWKDPLGEARNAERQRGYAKALDQRSVYTPQMIVNGDREVPASDSAAIGSALAGPTLAARTPGARIAMMRDDSTLHIVAEAPPAPEPGGQTVLILVTYRGKTQTDVERGENGGRRLVNTHAVRDWQIVSKMTNKPLELDMPVATLSGASDGSSGCAAILQRMDENGSPGSILAAAVLPF